VKDKATVMCKNQWGSDYSMVKFCIDKHMKAAAKIHKWNKSNGIYDKTPTGPAYDISLECFKQWRDPDTKLLDYSMFWYCVDKQWKAYQSLQ
jgi:hypothetical protein